MKKRVCAYARVSTNSRSQEHSFEFQSNYWNSTLSSNEEYEYIGLYADKGISGKYANRRPQFMQMVNAVKNHQIDMVFTKSVQRFARNTEELLTFAREFRELGVGIYFEKEQINTLTNGNDLFLTIAAAVAEDDLSRYHDNIVWSLKDKFRKGEPIVNGRMYGFKSGQGKSHLFEINEEEAKIVNRIYEMSLEGKSVLKIIDTLNKEGIPAPMGNVWHQNTVWEMLRNEKYVGDCLMQKTFRDSGEEYTNRGEKDKYFIKDHHKGIVSRELWDKVQEDLKRRCNTKLLGRVQKFYPFTNLIKCGCCGGTYTHKVSHSYYTPVFDVWYCRSKKDVCSSIRIKDSELKQLFTEAYNEFIENKYQGVEEKDIQNEMNGFINEKRELNRLHTNGWISIDDFNKEVQRLNKEISRLSEKLDGIKLRQLSETDFRKIKVFEDNKVFKFLSKVIITGVDVDFYFFNGVVVRKQIKQTRIYEKDKYYGGYKNV